MKSEEKKDQKVQAKDTREGYARKTPHTTGAEAEVPAAAELAVVSDEGYAT